MTLRVFIAGEGPNELGGWSREKPYRDDPPAEGAIEALLRNARPSGWQIVDAIRWKDIKKLKVREVKVGGERVTERSRSADEHHVAAANLRAKESRCDVLAFTRDRDGNTETQAAIERGIARAEESPYGVGIIGGVAIEKLESWIIALSGKSRSEQLGSNKIQEVLESLDIPTKDTSRFVEVISSADLNSIPADASSLLDWIEKAKSILRA